MSLSMNTQSAVPPGFRFHPTDEELVDYYLKKKVDSRSIDLDVIREIDLYKIEPWDLQEKCKIGSTEQTEWYFFNHKDKKYPTGTRTNRATTAGFWKATGRDKAIYGNLKLIGMRKTLVYYKGRAPNGQKSDWIMHEYRLESCENGCTQTSEEGWVVCRVFRKRCPNTQREIEQDSAFCLEDQMALFPELEFPKVGAHGELVTCSQPIFCKQELDLEYHLSRGPFLQMPQLESPKITCFTPSSSLNGLVMDNMCKPRAELQLYGNDSTIFGGMLIQPNAQNVASNSTNVEQQVTDWRALDRLIASQLSQEGTTKEFKLLPSGNDLQGDVALLLAHSKQSNQECDPYNDVDLLSFAQRDLPIGYVEED